MQDALGTKAGKGCVHRLRVHEIDRLAGLRLEPVHIVPGGAKRGDGALADKAAMPGDENSQGRGCIPKKEAAHAWPASRSVSSTKLS